jgi:hypothetical protein
MPSPQITERVALARWRELRGMEMVLGAHALDRLSDAQRQVYDRDELLTALRTEQPAYVGVQDNGRYAVFLQRKEYYLKVIIAPVRRRLEVVTFINVRALPSVQRR